MSLRERCCAFARAAVERAPTAAHGIVGLAALLALSISPPASAQASSAGTLVSADPAVQTIRARPTQRLSGLPRIDEISATGPGLYEVRLGTDLFYSDAQGNFFIRGEPIETRSQPNPTRERIDKLTAIDFIAREWRRRIASVGI